MCRGVCVDIENDSKNCGFCGHVCANGCTFGVCAGPTATRYESNVNDAAYAAAFAYLAEENGNITKFDLTSRQATVLAAGRANPSCIAVDDKNVYWLEIGTGDIGTLVAAPVAGGTPVTLGSSLSIGPTHRTPCIAAAGGSVYVTVRRDILAFPSTGGMPTTVASFVHFVDGGPDAGTAYVNGGQAIVIAGSTIYAAVSATTGSNGIYSVPIAGGAPSKVTDIGSGSAVSQMQVDGSSIYWIGYSGQLLRVDAAGGTAAPIIPQNVLAYGFDAANVYWADTLGTIKYHPKSGGADMAPAKGPPVGNNSASGAGPVTVFGESLFFAVRDDNVAAYGGLYAAPLVGADQ